MGRKILESIIINGMEVPNRISFGPMLGNPSGEDWEVTEDTIEWFLQRAKGQVGLAISGTLNPLKEFFEENHGLDSINGFPHPLSFHNDSYMDGYKKLTREIHKYDMKIGAQVGAGGLKGSSESPFAKRSVMDLLLDLDIPTEAVTLDEIYGIIDEMAQCAARVKEAGFDCVELHTAHGYVSLWGGFMSPMTNKRTDQYGGNWENNLRFPCETIQAMRKAVGDDFPILIRISADELVGPEGVTLEDSLKYSIPMLEEAGVDCFDVTMGTQLHNPNNIPPLYVPRGHFMYIPEAVKKVANVPVIGVGRILELEMAEKFIEEGKADIICLGRQLLADPETPKKYFEGRPEDVKKCIGDLYGFGGCEESCAINPTPPNMVACSEVGNGAEKKKKILVIGGGVAGMEFARIAALRNHYVTLVEKEGKLGGNVDILANTSLNYEFRNIVDYLTVQMQKLKIDVSVCKNITEEEILQMNPDAVVLATGSEMSITGPAQDKLHVMTHIDALKNIYTIGKRVVIQGLGYGAELAIELAENGHDVVIFGKAKELASNLGLLRRWWVVKRLIPEANVARADGDIPMSAPENPKVMTNTRLMEVTAKDVIVQNGENDETINIPYDNLIISMGRKSNNQLYEALKDKVSEVHKIGDCKGIGEIYDAMNAANKLAREI